MSATSRRKRKARAEEQAAAKETVVLLTGVVGGLKVRSRDGFASIAGHPSAGEYGVIWGTIMEGIFFEVLYVGGRIVRYRWREFSPNGAVWLAP